MSASFDEQERPGNTDSAIERQGTKISEGIIGLVKDSAAITDVSFDILSLEALFLLPRVCSLLSLVPFFGTLVGSYSSVET